MIFFLEKVLLRAKCKNASIVIYVAILLEYQHISTMLYKNLKYYERYNIYEVAGAIVVPSFLFTCRNSNISAPMSLFLSFSCAFILLPNSWSTFPKISQLCTQCLVGKRGYSNLILHLFWDFLTLGCQENAIFFNKLCKNKSLTMSLLKK